MEFEQILKLVDHVSASHLESFCYESDGVKLTLNNKIAPVIIPGTMQNNILSGAETGEKGSVYGEKYSISEQAPDRKMADKELSASEKKPGFRYSDFQRRTNRKYCEISSGRNILCSSI
mgnify:FL=1